MLKMAWAASASSLWTEQGSVNWEKNGLCSTTPGATLWTQKTLLIRSEGYAACVQVGDTH